ncbi:MAG: zinc-binding dehydrogenase [Solirubrobacteraceae bacterium]|nr:zinc-binding dehydrogenase [Solirubrobacteraceae bacterium]
MSAVRAAVLTRCGDPGPFAETRPIEVRELGLGDPGPGEVRVRIRAAGLCHSDLSVIDGNRPRPVPMVLGHEAAGEVVATGPDCTLAPGDRVVLAFVPACGECEPCLSGRAALCEPGAAANTDGTLLVGERRWRGDGEELIHHHLGVSAFAEEVIVSERSAVPIPDDLPYETAAVFGCAVLTGVGAAMNAADIEPGSTVAVVGLGGVGISAVMGARLAGAGEVIAVDPVAFKREKALELGASEAIDPGDDLAGQLREAAGEPPASVIETVGSATVLRAAYEATARGGTTVTVGLPAPDAMLSIPAVSLVTEERTLRGSYHGSGAPREILPRLFDEWRAGNLPADQLITDRLTLDELNEGFDRLASGEQLRQVAVP